ncbi:hypothetical protein GCM10012275_63520 [Longimycelium tulufanense]|uniref:N-acetyltransferase domain-containing protein n=1 Tax=Longimycelium tulufanense TaxID=907463 RepID=A0A8J3CKL4_9PSEU|nr:GNAT family N-acetyltransferase [Longimycelium tulufanense]GGM84170.1 hypothetical protein GCM10012275_63520 [Longimycelium tulufanense]
MPLVTIEQAQPRDADQVLALLDEAAAWLRSRGIHQWPERFTGRDDWRAKRIRAYIAAGQTYVVRADTALVACFTLSGADPHFAHGWPDGPDNALYIYRMAVRRTWAGLDLGGRILDWAGARATTLDYRWLRLDCHRDNTALQRYYQARGFELVGTVVSTIDPTGNDNPDAATYTRGSGALYQRPASQIAILTSNNGPTPQASNGLPSTRHPTR